MASLAPEVYRSLVTQALAWPVAVGGEDDPVHRLAVELAFLVDAVRRAHDLGGLGVSVRSDFSDVERAGRLVVQRQDDGHSIFPSRQ